MATWHEFCLYQEGRYQQPAVRSYKLSHAIETGIHKISPQENNHHDNNRGVTFAKTVGLSSHTKMRVFPSSDPLDNGFDP